MEEPKTDGRIFASSLLILLVVVVPLTIWPERGGELLDTAYGFITAHFGVVYLWAGVAVLVFVLWLALGRYGDVKLGAEGSSPRFSDFSWVSMLFCAGVATGILYWGTIEWVEYFESPPYGASSPTASWPPRDPGI